MAMEYISRNAVITAVDTMTAIGDLVAAASGAITVPPSARRIAQIVAAVTADSANTGAASFLLRLSGNGLLTTQNIPVAAVGGTLATGAAVQATALVLPTDIATNGNGQITVEASMNEVDLGSAPVAIGLGFQDS